MAKSVADGMGGKRDEFYTCPPEYLVIVLDKKNVLYDERGDPDLFPLAESMVEDVMNRGIINNVKVRRNGSWPDGRHKYEVVCGRQRVRSAVEANRRLALSGQKPIIMKLDVVTGTDDEMFQLMQRENSQRQGELPSHLVSKIERAVRRGFVPTEIMEMFKLKSPATLQKYRDMADLHPDLVRAADRGIPLSTLLGLGSLDRSEQPAALAALEANGSVRGESAREATREVLGGVLPAKPRKKKQKRSLRWKDIEEEKQEVLNAKKQGRFWEGYLAGLAVAQGEAKKTALEKAPGGE